MRNKKGQIILALILVITVALAVGLSIIQRSLVDVSTSTKVEQSSRAFSAAEAGIEKALRGDSSGVDFTAVNQSKTIQVVDTNLIPATATAPKRQAVFEYPLNPLAKEEIAQIWLADLNSTSSSPTTCGPNIQCFYTQKTLDVYWGKVGAERAALELTLIYYNGTQYVSKKWYLDSTTRTPANNFDQVNSCAGHLNTYQCKVTLGDPVGDPSYNKPGYGLLPSGLILLRARLLYNATSQPLAFQAVGDCGLNCSIPPQGRVVRSVGASGETQRGIQVSQELKVVPPYFDYAIFSVGEIRK